MLKHFFDKKLRNDYVIIKSRGVIITILSHLSHILALRYNYLYDFYDVMPNNFMIWNNVMMTS